MLFLFDTSHLAHWAEEIATEEGIPVDLIPAPPEAEDRCGLALRAGGERAEELAELLRAEGVDFRLAGRD